MERPSISENKEEMRKWIEIKLIVGSAIIDANRIVAVYSEVSKSGERIGTEILIDSGANGERFFTMESKDEIMEKIEEASERGSWV